MGILPQTYVNQFLSTIFSLLLTSVLDKYQTAA